MMPMIHAYALPSQGRRAGRAGELAECFVATRAVGPRAPPQQGDRFCLFSGWVKRPHRARLMCTYTYYGGELARDKKKSVYTADIQ